MRRRYSGTGRLARPADIAIAESHAAKHKLVVVAIKRSVWTPEMTVVTYEARTAKGHVINRHARFGGGDRPGLPKGVEAEVAAFYRGCLKPRGGVNA